MLENADAILLARIQFAFTIAFHILFPAFTIGLASYLAVLEGLYIKTRNLIYLNIYNYWLKIFAVAFGMGVVSGVVMTYQFGSNWSVFSDRTAPIIGPLLGYEVLTAFFLEAGFLGIMLFGLKRVGLKLHFTATLMVAIGTLFSAFWILSANSWMQTPVGYSINDVGQFVPDDWLQVIFNPSFPYRLVHMVIAAYLTTAFVVGGVAAYHLLRDNTNERARLMLSMAMWMAAIVAPIQLLAGDLHGLNTFEHQPIKVAAMEGHFETQKGAPLVLIGFPNEEAGRTDVWLEIPKLGSLILAHELLGEIKGLNAWPREEWPPVAIVFWSFRVMVGIGMLMILVGGISLWLRFRKRLYESRAFHRLALYVSPAGFVAIIAGWIVTEVGRQPYTVYGLLRTNESASPIAFEGVATSLAAFVIVYIFVFGAGIFYILRKMRRGPEAVESEPPSGHPIQAAGITPAPSVAPDRVIKGG